MTPAKKAAAKKAASKPADSGDNDTQPAEGDKPTGKTRQDFGPGTPNPGAPPESSERPPATIVNTDPNAAPLDPPADHAGQTEPPLGYPTSTTDQTYAQVAGRSIAGETHVELVDSEGNELSADDMFDDPGGVKTFVTTRTRIYERFTYPNTKRVANRLLYVEGARIPRWQAERIKAAVEAGA